MELEKIALEDDYFVERKLFPNVDFYSGIILQAMGIPTSMFTAIFALARTVGWAAQWNEMVEDPEQKIGRPRQLYTGRPSGVPTCRSSGAAEAPARPARRRHAPARPQARLARRGDPRSGTPFAPSMIEARLRRDAQGVLGRAIASGWTEMRRLLCLLIMLAGLLTAGSALAQPAAPSPEQLRTLAELLRDPAMQAWLQAQAERPSPEAARPPAAASERADAQAMMVSQLDAMRAFLRELVAAAADPARRASPGLDHLRGRTRRHGAGRDRSS